MLKIIISVWVFFEWFLLMRVQCIKPIIRQTSNGPVEGIEQISALHQRYYSFRGIPYAEPPITSIDPYTGEKVDRRFKVWSSFMNINKYILNIRHAFIGARSA